MLLVTVQIYFFLVYLVIESATQLRDDFVIEEVVEEKSYFPLRTRSLNNGHATDGRAEINDEVYRIFMLTILDGFAIFKIKMYNDRSFIYLTRRNYWLGDRYYYMDNKYFLATRDTCAYRMNETQREHLFYEEDNMPIFDIIYQCQRYQEYCCGLDCCKLDQLGVRPEPHRRPKYPWDDPWRMSAYIKFDLNSLFVSVVVILLSKFVQ